MQRIYEFFAPVPAHVEIARNILKSQFLVRVLTFSGNSEHNERFYFNNPDEKGKICQWVSTAILQVMNIERFQNLPASASSDQEKCQTKCLKDLNSIFSRHINSLPVYRESDDSGRYRKEFLRVSTNRGKQPKDKPAIAAITKYFSFFLKERYPELYLPWNHRAILLLLANRDPHSNFSKLPKDMVRKICLDVLSDEPRRLSSP